MSDGHASTEVESASTEVENAQDEGPPSPTPGYIQRLPEGSLVRQLLEQAELLPEKTPEEEAAREREQDEVLGGEDHVDDIPCLPPATDYSAFPERPEHPLEAVYKRAMAGAKTTKSDMQITNGVIEIVKLGFENMMNSRGTDCCMPGEVVSCLVCYGLLIRPYTLACGHTMCEACLGKYRKCLLPGTTCRDAPSFVILTPQGHVEREGAAAARSTDVTATLNRTMHILMQRAFPNEHRASELKDAANKALAAGNLTEASSLYRQALHTSPCNHVLHGNLAQVLLKQGKFTEAIKWATSSAFLCPRWHKAHFRRGAAMQGMSRYLNKKRAHCLRFLPFYHQVNSTAL